MFPKLGISAKMHTYICIALYLYIMMKHSIKIIQSVSKTCLRNMCIDSENTILPDMHISLAIVKIIEQ